MKFAENRTPPGKPSFRQHVTALDGLRGVAILAVFFYHYASGAKSHTNSATVQAVSVVFGFGWAGVDLFFVLSGFLIAGILYDTLADTGYYKNFYVRRILRIFPIYYLVVVIFLLLTPFLNVHLKAAHLFFLVYLGYPAALIWPPLVQISRYVAITHLWSLSLEEQFYTIWPWVIARLRKPEIILRACLIMAGAALLFRTGICATGWLNRTWAYTFLLCRMDCIATGVAIAILVRGPLRERLQRWAPSMFVLAASIVFTICVFRRTVEHDDALIATLGFTFIAMMFGALLLLALREKSWTARFLSWPVLRMFGKYSYGLYLYHFPMTVILGPLKEFFVLRMHSYVLGATVHLTVNLVVNLLVAAASFHFFESPIMRLKDRFNYGQRDDPREKPLVRLIPASDLSSVP
jgi:peptidoglycan/LPS O-acetylase OafA/YrhL